MNTSTWKRQPAAEAERDHAILTPQRVDGAPVYVMTADGFTAWCYRCEPTFMFAHGQPFVYWIRRDADRVEWVGDGPRLRDAQLAAADRTERIRRTGRG